MADDDQNEELQEQQTEQQVQEAENGVPYYLQNQGLSFDDFKKHLRGPLLSIVFHVILLLVVGTAVISEPPPQEPPEVVVEMKEVKVTPPPPPPPPPETEVEETEVTDFTDVPMERPTVDHTAVTLTNTVTDVATSTNVNDIQVKPTNLTAPVSNSALKLPALFAARGSAKTRLASAKTYGGGANTEAAVMKALKWLAKVQNEDGTWGDNDPAYAYHKVQLTCLALLAYLAHGDTPQSEEFGEPLIKGLKKVSEWAEQAYKWNGWIGLKQQDWMAHARVAIVLAEGYAITKIPTLERAMNKAIEKMVKEQNPIGGWGQHTVYDKETRQNKVIYWSNLDINSRMYNALYSAFAAGCEVQGLAEAVDKALKAIEENHSCGDGGFAENIVSKDKKKGSKGTFEMTSAGTLYIYLMGGGSRPAAEKGLKWLENYRPQNKEKSELKMDWKNLPGTMSILGWYYMTQALFQGHSGQGKEWKKWNSSMVSSLCREQTNDGYWPCPADKYPVMIDVPIKDKDGKVVVDKKTGKPKTEKQEKVMAESSVGGFSELNGRLWATVYFTMSLEVYYRYLPTYKVGKVKKGAAEKEAEVNVMADSADDDDLSLD